MVLKRCTPCRALVYIFIVMATLLFLVISWQNYCGTPTARVSSSSSFDEVGHLFHSKERLSSGLFIPIGNRVDVLGSCKVFTEPYVFARHEIVPVFLISYERPYALKMTVAALNKLRDPVQVVVVDYGSQSEGMKELLARFEAEGEVKVIREKNLGKFANFEQLGVHIAAFMGSSVKFFVVSDPDILLSSNADLLSYYASILTACPKLDAVGPALNLLDIPSTYPLKKEAVKWESQFWAKPSPISWMGVSSVVFKARFDTTFHMSRAGVWKKSLPGMWKKTIVGVRTSYPYVARHSDWYLDPEKLTADESNYVRNSESNWAKIFPMDPGKKVRGKWP